MKKSKTCGVILTLAITCVVFVSCSKDYSSPLKGLHVEDMQFYFQSGTNTVTIGNIDLSSFSTMSSESWCSTSIIGTTLSVSVQNNFTDQARQALVTIVDPGDDTSLSFKVYQSPEGIIRSGSDTYTIPEEGGELTINIQSNVEYEIEISSDANWLTQSYPKTRSMKDSKIVLKADRNDSGDERSTYIKLINSETGTIEKLKIVQEINPYVDADIEQIEGSRDGGEVEFDITTNVAYIVQCKGSLSLIEDRQIDRNHFKIRIKVDPLTENSPRTSHVYFRWPKDNRLLYTLSVFQDAWLYIRNSDFTLYEGDAYFISYKNNTGDDVVWKSSNTSVAIVDNEGRVTAVGPGNATITLSSANGKYTDDVTVNVVSDDVESNLSHTWSISYLSIGGQVQASIGCTLKNNSRHDIELTKLTTYKDGKYLNSTTDSSLLGLLPSGGTKGITIDNVRNFTTITFSWEYTYNGKSYTYNCEYIYTN